MAPIARETPCKAPPKVQRSATKSVSTKNKKTSSPAGINKPKMNTRVPLQKVELRQRTKTDPAPCTPKRKDIKPVPAPNTSCKKPVWKRRPLPAHSGVPVPEKMKLMLQKRLQELDDSL